MERGALCSFYKHATPFNTVVFPEISFILPVGLECPILHYSINDTVSNPLYVNLR
jgi:hypothetical protein